VFSALGFFRVFIEHGAGTVHPTMQWLSLSGIHGKGSLTAAMLISIFLFLATVLNPLSGAGLEVSSRDKFVPLGGGV
jgi:hypothetical protein